MTIRTELARKKRRVFLTALFGFAVFLIGVYLHSRSAEFPISSMFGFGVAVLAMMYAYIDIRCPQCNNSLGELVIYSGHPFSISGKFKYCPYCGVDIDSTLSHTPHRI